MTLRPPSMLRHGLELLCSQPWLRYGQAVLIAACLLALVAGLLSSAIEATVEWYSLSLQSPSKQVLGLTAQHSSPC